MSRLRASPRCRSTCAAAGWAAVSRARSRSRRSARAPRARRRARSPHAWPGRPRAPPRRSWRPALRRWAPTPRPWRTSRVCRWPWPARPPASPSTSPRRPRPPRPSTSRYRSTRHPPASSSCAWRRRSTRTGSRTRQARSRGSERSSLRVSVVASREPSRTRVPAGAAAVDAFVPHLLFAVVARGEDVVRILRSGIAEA